MNEDKYYLINDEELVMSNLSVEDLKKHFGNNLIFIELSKKEYDIFSGFIQQKYLIDLKLEKLLKSIKERYNQ